MIGKVHILDKRFSDRPEIAYVGRATPTTIIVQTGEEFDRKHGHSVRDPMRRIALDDLAVIRMTLAEKGL